MQVNPKDHPTLRQAVKRIYSVGLGLSLSLSLPCKTQMVEATGKHPLMPFACRTAESQVSSLARPYVYPARPRRPRLPGRSTRHYSYSCVIKRQSLSRVNHLHKTSLDCIALSYHAMLCIPQPAHSMPHQAMMSPPPEFPRASPFPSTAHRPFPFRRFQFPNCIFANC